MSRTAARQPQEAGARPGVGGDTDPGGTGTGRRGALRWSLVVLTGLGAGFLAGLFGVGGGLVIVPALMAVLGMDQRRAAATSLAAIVLTAAVGAATYASSGEVSLPAAGITLVGSLVGAQLGTRLLRRLPARVLPWVFVGFVVLVVASQQVHAPVRQADVHLGGWHGAGMVAVGLAAGVLAGLVGVGGGAVIVPGLELVGGLGDLMARGTSLLVMIPTAASGTWSNARHHVVDLPVAAVVGAGSVVAAPAGTWVAGQVSPRTGVLLFNLFLLVVVTRMLLRARRARERTR